MELRLDLWYLTNLSYETICQGQIKSVFSKNVVVWNHNRDNNRDYFS